MKIQIIHTTTRIYRGRVEKWEPLGGGPAGTWEFVRRATAKDRKRIITVR